MAQSAKSSSTEHGVVDHTYVSKGAELVVGGKKYHADFKGKFSSHHDPEHLSHFHKGGRSNVEHRIHGHTAQGHGSGIGTITMRQDPDNEPHPSSLTATVPGQAFPAVHEIAMNVHVTIPDLLPGVTLRNKPS
ncbi:MAG: hypothetical protein JO110_24475, partial [Acetobacteraceae bacterium]|nr:hypothetical protein [Acetobacteraceae bacterium]